MSIENKDDFSEVVDITLYKYNSIDIKIWGLIQRDVESKKLADESYLISASKMQIYINKWFSADVNRFQSVGEMSIHKEATSIYFIWQMLNNISNLSWIKVNLNNNIKIIRGSLRLFDLFETRELNIVNDIMDRCKLLSDGQMYKVFKLRKFMNVLDMYLTDDTGSETFSVINTIIQKLEPYEMDDPEILLITDRNSDI
jgi:hypothetical protein